MYRHNRHYLNSISHFLHLLFINPFPCDNSSYMSDHHFLVTIILIPISCCIPPLPHVFHNTSTMSNIYFVSCPILYYLSDIHSRFVRFQPVTTRCNKYVAKLTSRLIKESLYLTLCDPNKTRSRSTTEPVTSVYVHDTLERCTQDLRIHKHSLAAD